MASKNKSFVDDGWAVWVEGDDVSTVYINDWINPKGKSWVDFAIKIRGINKDLNKLRNETNKLQQQLDTLKKEYAILMYHTYFKKSKYEELMFVLSAKDFAESFRRYRYIKQYSEYCQKKTEEINKRLDELYADYDEAEQLLSSMNVQE